MKNSVSLMVIASIFLLSAGCICMPTRVSEAPLPQAEQDRLEQMLIGVWYMAATESRRGNVDPNEPHQFVYHFDTDGTGKYVQDYMVSATNPFEWELRGRNLHLQMERGGREAVYRIDEYDERAMRWFNYFDSGYFLMERQK